MLRDVPRTVPLPAPTLAEARASQFRLMECIAGHFEGHELLVSDLGVVPGLGRPRTTAKAEAALADFFGVAACALTQGAGTGAIRAMLSAALGAGERIVVHGGPPYATTRTSFQAMGLDLVEIDYNSLQGAGEVTEHAKDARFGYVQHARHDLNDVYSPTEVIGALKRAGLRVLVDDNYTAFSVPRIGVELGADASAFSLFKLLGPEGVGCVLGAEDIISMVHSDNYSGGGQVQGHQALDALRALVTVPVLTAIKAEVVDEVVNRLESGEVPGIMSAQVMNAQDRMVLIVLDEPIAQAVVDVSSRFGGQNYPVGANSRYEIAPFIYRLSGANLEARPDLANYAIRVNPVRAGADQVLKLLSLSIEAAKS